ncbi:MAG TPA: UDP binding domain-containing protein, partial [Spirochaetia bacterium]|nr:UDP binding domain-containing protein [Spirochaetia bacterium]
FLHPGPGYGGSCFPKDTQALAHTGRQYGFSVSLVEAAIKANERQKLLMVEKISKALGDVQGSRIAILGLAFKPNTDDMREAPSLTIIEELVKKGASCSLYDPAAMKEALWRLKHLGDSLSFYENEYDTMKDADAVVIITEWNQFRNMDLGRVKSLLRKPFFFDLRNIYDKRYVESFGLSYTGVGT